MAQQGSGAIGIFLLKLLGMYILWFGIHDQYLVTKTSLVFDFICIQARISVDILNLFDLHDVFTSNQNLILRNGFRILSVGEECSGLILFAVFGGFIVAFPGDWFSKAWFIPVGIVILLLLNISRITLLTLNKAYFNSIFAFNHHVTFTYGMYAIIFGLWYYWMKFLRKTPNHV